MDLYNRGLDAFPLAFRSGGSILDVDSTPTKAAVLGSFSEVNAQAGSATEARNSFHLLPLNLFSPSKSYSDVLSATETFTNSLKNFFSTDKQVWFDAEGEDQSLSHQPFSCSPIKPMSSWPFSLPQAPEPANPPRGLHSLPPIRTCKFSPGTDGPQEFINSHNVVETAAPYPDLLSARGAPRDALALSFHQGGEYGLLIGSDLTEADTLEAAELLPSAATTSRNESASGLSGSTALNRKKRHSDSESVLSHGDNLEKLSDMENEEEEEEEEEEDNGEDGWDRPKRQKLSSTKTLKKKFESYVVKGGFKQACRNCSTTQTPQWREGPEGARTLCNACGLRFRKGLSLTYWSK